MLSFLESKITAQNANAVKYINIFGLKDSEGEIKKINLQINRDFGLVGPLTLSTPSLRIHAIRWATARESFVVESNIKRVTKEIVAAGIAQINKCPYCEDVHGTSISSTGDNETSKAIANGTWESLKDERTKAIIEWSLNTRNPTAKIIKNPPFSIDEAPEIIGTALVFHSTNRLVSLFLEESPLPSFLSTKLMKKTALKIASKTLFKSMVMKKASAGESLQFIQDYKIPKSVERSNAVPSFSKVLIAEEILLNEIEKEIIPQKIVALFKEKVNNWEGEEMPLGRGWLSELTNGLNKDEIPIANLIFLSAFSPHTIIKNDINKFRKINPTDKDLVEICFWSIQILTNKISDWLTKPFIETTD